MWHLSVFGTKQVEMLCELRISSCLWRLFIFTILLNQGSGGSNARTTNVMSSNPDQIEMYSNTTLCDKVCQWHVTDRWLSLGTLVSSQYKIDHHDIAEILLKVALKTIKITLIFKCRFPSLWSRVGIPCFVLKISFYLLNSNFRGFHCYHQATKFSYKPLRSHKTRDIYLN